MQYPTLQQVQGLPDPAANWLWTMDIVLPDNGTINSLQVLEVNFPFSYVDVVSRYRAGTFLYFPGHSNIDQVSVSFYETTDFIVLQIFKNWQRLIIDQKGNYAEASKYLGTATLHLYDYRGQERATCNLLGVWPARLTDWPLNYQSSGHLQVQVNFSVNSSDFVFLGAGSAPAAASRPVQPQITPAVNRPAGMGANNSPAFNGTTGLPINLNRLPTGRALGGAR